MCSVTLRHLAHVQHACVTSEDTCAPVRLSCVAQAARRAMREGAWLRALLVTLRLKDVELLRQVILGTPPQEVHPLCLSVCDVVLSCRGNTK